ncbi:alpha/beta fold hydrolase [Halosegnis marinus]|uniref:alpha/beta fold hydrolase n=1 Tax=Halosegnis marinus TaxID=3034023 RepID=UPI003611266F
MDSRTVAGGGGVDIRVDAYGPADARPVLMLHGYSQCRLAWRGQYRSSLADDYRLLCVDLRGHGASDKPRDAYDDPALWAADIEAVLDAFGAEDAAVVAWSYAGLVALDYLAERGRTASRASTSSARCRASGRPRRPPASARSTSG